ncbi:hypothetical protein BDZ89DRAFT_1048533 [Hymenopellis radicata]|nr:hypothetical protein BDZ89DRAFT_1048533 [Hymenopellis radicata]
MEPGVAALGLLSCIVLPFGSAWDRLARGAHLEPLFRLKDSLSSRRSAVSAGRMSSFFRVFWGELAFIRLLGATLVRSSSGGPFVFLGATLVRSSSGGPFVFLGELSFVRLLTSILLQRLSPSSVGLEPGSISECGSPSITERRARSFSSATAASSELVWRGRRRMGIEAGKDGGLITRRLFSPLLWERR